MSFYQELFAELKAKALNKDKLNKLKMCLAKKYKLQKIPTDIEIFLNAENKDVPKLKKLLQTKPTRSISGVTPIAVMSKPMPCPHGKCIFCPGGPKSEFGDVPQSYTGKEPATMRGIRANYDPYIQVFNRLEQYMVSGHVPQKCDIIIMGGTFPSYPKEYQEQFVTEIFQAMNDFSKLFFDGDVFDFNRFKKFFLLPGEVGNDERTATIQKQILQLKNKSKTTLIKEQNKNEKSNIRCIGLTIETRPDWGFAEQGNWLLQLGCTRVELGVQSVYDKPLRLSQRGHTTKDSIKAIQELRDLGFKLNFHYMLGLPGMTKKEEKKGLKELFQNPNYKPDMLKIYPCMVMPGTELEKLWKQKKYTPVTTEEAGEIIADFKPNIPEYCRVMRVQRDIPTNRTLAGVDKTNLRQYVEQIMKKKGIKCRCIRCREAGHVFEKRNIKPKKIEIIVRVYDASDGKEFFISAEDKKQDILLGFCRLRFPSESLRKEITKDSAIIRELHVYGSALGLSEKGEIQHKGWGKELMKKAEEIAKKHKKKKILVISGIGVKEYYYNLGYEKDGPYVSKYI